MYESTRNNKTVFGFAVRDTAAAWQVARKYMNDKYFRPHEEYRDLYYTTAPGLGMQYLQFFKTDNEIQVVTFLGGPAHPVPLSGMPPQTADSVRIAMKGMLEPLSEMESQEAAFAQPAPEAPAAESTAAPGMPAETASSPTADTQEEPVPEVQTPVQETHSYTVQQTIPDSIPQTPDAGFVGGQAPAAQPTANETLTADGSGEPQPAAFGYGGSTQSRTLPQDPQGTRYAYDPVNGGPNDRASNATAGLVLGIIGLLMALVGMGIPVLGVLGLLVLTPALICSVNGRRSRRRGVATAGLVISILSVALVIFETLVWFEILRG